MLVNHLCVIIDLERMIIFQRYEEKEGKFSSMRPNALTLCLAILRHCLPSGKRFVVGGKIPQFRQS